MYVLRVQKKRKDVDKYKEKSGKDEMKCGITEKKIVYIVFW
jgi:hypothetical protein